MQKFIATLTNKIEIGPNIFEVELDCEVNLNDYEPGQYLNLLFDPGVYRSYSIASYKANSIKLIIQILPGGATDRFFHHSNIGVSIDCMGPIGRFNLISSNKKKLFIATGTGIAPILPMLKQLKYKNCELIYGAKTIAEDISSHFLTTTILQLHLCLSQEKKKDIYFGRVTDFYREFSQKYLNCEFYICGNPNMVQEMIDLLIASGITKENIVTEKFIKK
jgi:all-trans-retinol 13,14-reductase